MGFVRAIAVVLGTGAFVTAMETCKVMPLGKNYTQETAPQDISLVEAVVLQKANEVIDNLLSVRTFVGCIRNNANR